MRHWGFFGRPGWHAARVFATPADAERELARLLKRREREGYAPAPAVGPSSTNQLTMILDAHGWPEVVDG